MIHVCTQRIITTIKKINTSITLKSSLGAFAVSPFCPFLSYIPKHLLFQFLPLLVNLHCLEFYINGITQDCLFFCLQKHHMIGPSHKAETDMYEHTPACTYNVHRSSQTLHPHIPHASFIHFPHAQGHPCSHPAVITSALPCYSSRIILPH